MRRMKYEVIAICTAAFVAATPHAEAADNFTSAELLKQPLKQQAAYIDIAVQMVGFVVSQNDGSQARCIDSWYFQDQATRDRKVQHVTEVMRQHPQYHPGSVVLAVLEKACGAFKYR